MNLTLAADIGPTGLGRGQSTCCKLLSRCERLRLRICVLFLAMVSSLLAQTKSPSIEQPKPDFVRVQKYVQDHMAAESVPSVAIAVGRGGEILWEQGFGWADRENGIKATANTPYYLASVTKSLTGTALMVLQERRKLDLDDPVNEYLGPVKVHSPMWDATQATVRRMATHTAGLTTYARDCVLDNPGCRISTDTAIQRYGILFWPPGDHFDYSNLGYGILGDVVARVSGKGYGDFLYDEIFQPLGMADCALGVNQELRKRVAAQYDQTTHTPSPLRSSDHPGASSVRCSVHDLARFGMFALKAHVSGQKVILSESSRDAMVNSSVDTGDGQRYGIGWWVNPDLYGYRAVFGGGGTTDSSSDLYTIPSEGIGVAVLSNTGTTLPSKVVEEVLSEMLPKFRREREKTAQSHEPPTDSSNATQLPTGQKIRNFFGKWRLAGQWMGEIETWEGAVPLTMSISSTQEIHTRIGSQDGVLQQAVVEDGHVYGVVQGDVGTPDAPRSPYNLEFELYLRGDTLAGAATTRALPGKDGAALPYWVTLRKTP